MGKRFYSTYKSVKDWSYTIEIWDTLFSGTATTFNTDQNGAVIKMEGKGNERHSVIVGTSCAFTMYIQDATQEAIITDLLTAKEGRFSVQVKKGTRTVWTGIIVSDVSSYDEAPYPYSFDISATDGIGLLKHIDYGNSGVRYTGVKRLTEHIVNCLNKIPHVSTFYAPGDEFLRTALDWWDISMTSGASSDPLYLSYVDHATFYKFKKKGKLEFTSCYDVLEGILSVFGARIMHIDGHYFIEQITVRTAATSFNTRYYDTTGAYLSFDAQTNAFTVDQSDIHSAVLSMANYEFLPPLSKVDVEFQAFSRRNYLAGVEVSQNNTFETLTYSMVKNADDAIFRLTGKLNIRIKNINHTVTTFEPLFLLFKLVITLDTKTLKRKATISNWNINYGAVTWGTTGTGDIAYDLGVMLTGGVPPTGSSTWYTLSQNIDIYTPALPNDAQHIDWGFYLNSFQQNNGTTLTLGQFEIEYNIEDPWLEVYDQGDPSQSDYSLIQSAENPDTTNSYPYEIQTLIGDTDGNPNVVGRLKTYNGSVYTNTSLWGAGTNARDRSIIMLLSSLVLEGQLTPIRKFQATIFGLDIEQIRCLSWAGEKWLMLGADLNTGMDEISGEWFELKYGTPVSLSPTIKIVKYQGGLGPGGITGDPSGSSGNQPNPAYSLSSSPPPSILGPISFNTLLTSKAKGVTITSIPIAIPSAGNEFLAGDGVVIVNPVSGQYQEFAISTPPGAGDTSLSVTSEVLDFDAPEGAYLVVKQKAYAFSLPNAVLGQILRYNGTAWVAFSGTNGEFLKWVTGSGWISAAVSGGSGTVTSVGLSLPAIFSVSGSPVTTSGTLTAALATQLANLIWAGPVSGGAATPTFRAMVTADIPNDTVTYAKLQNISATLRVLGRIAAGAGDAEELTAANLYTIMSLLNGAADQIAFFTGANGMSSNAGLKWLQASSQLSVEGGAGVPWFVGASGASIAGSVVLMGMSRNISGDLQSYMKNTRNLSNTGTVTQVYSVGGSAAGNITILFEVLATKSLAMGIHNTVAGDPFRITPNSTTVGGVANAGITLTQDAVPLFGINKDAPVYPLDVSGRARASQYIGVGGAWGAGNIAFAGGAGTGPVLNSIAGPINAFTITFTTGTAPTANATIFNATYPTTFPAVAVPVFSARSFTSAADLNKFYLSANNAGGFTFQATGTLTASTQYAFTFSIFGS